MKTASIICEYNPLHYGHCYQIQKTLNAGATHIIAVLSDDFVQRGEPALLSKFDRAELALQAGADLVLELPVPYSCACAELYASGAVALLQDFQVTDFLSFGCSAELSQLQELAEISIQISESSAVQKFLKQGYSYPKAVFQTIAEQSLNPELLLDANNLLAVEYLKAMQKQNVSFQPFAVRRTGVSHDSTEISGKFASGRLIRNAFAKHQPYAEYLPAFTADLLHQRYKEGKTADFERISDILLYQIRMFSPEELNLLPDMTEPLANRILKAKNAVSLEQFFATVCTKSYTKARVRRILISALLKIRKSDFKIKIPYARILAFNSRGRELLKLSKKVSRIPSDTSLARLQTLSPESERFAVLETNTANLYGLAQASHPSTEQEFRQKIMMK